jgi:alkylhydroperoxidase/carboxymuconolactone decarboxylase family protein YurZ
LHGDALAVHDAIVGGSRASAARVFPLADDEGRLYGPFNAMLVNPSVGDAMQRLGAALRFSSHLTDRQREIAILTVAVVLQSEFEWRSHERIAASVGVTDDELEALAQKTPAASFDEAECFVQSAVKRLLAVGDLDDTQWGKAVALLGTIAALDLVVLVGHYNLLALTMRVARVPLPDGVAPVVWAP